MAKAFYVGVGGKARRAKKMYVSVGGTAHKIKKVYTGVDGKAKLVFSDIPVTGIELSWRIGGPYWNGSFPSGSIAGGEAEFKAVITPAEATNKKLTWSISGGCSMTGYSDTSCSVRADGTGNSYLTVTSADGVVARAQIYVARQQFTHSDGSHYLTGYANAITSISRW